MRYHYYNVNVPSDCFETEYERYDYALYIAKEQARDYIVPAIWYIPKTRSIHPDSDIIRVCRKTR